MPGSIQERGGVEASKPPWFANLALILFSGAVAAWLYEEGALEVFNAFLLAP